MNKIKITIITVSFNSQKTIARTIESVVGQSYDNIEYCIVDGNSSDGTVDIIKRYYALFPDIIKYVSEPDEGIYDAMNKGIRMSSGEIVGIVNSDDWLEKDAIQFVYDSVATNDFSMDCIYTGGIMFHGKHKDIAMMPNLLEMKKKSRMYYMGGIKHPATFVPRRIYNSFGLYNAEMKISADTDFILRCYFGGVAIIPMNRILSNMAEGGISTTLSFKTLKLGYSDYKRRLVEFNVPVIRKKYLQLCDLVMRFCKILKGFLVK